MDGIDDEVARVRQEFLAKPEREGAKKRDAAHDAKLAEAVTDYGYNEVGPSAGDLIYKSTGWAIAERPTVVICQARQTENQNHGWEDQFSIQVVETSSSFVRFRIRRIDDGTGSTGWGQNLRVDTIVIN